MTHGPMTLPGLQDRLDALELGEQLTLSGASCERLFGIDDAAMGRLHNFARGHGCIADSRIASVTFHKQPAPVP